MSSSAPTAIEHIVVLMLENRPVDHKIQSTSSHACCMTIRYKALQPGELV